MRYLKLSLKYFCYQTFTRLHTSITESQTSRMVEFESDILLQPPAQEGPPRRGFSGPCLDNFKVSLKMEPLQPLWTTQSLSQQTTLSSCSAETSCFILCPLLLALSVGTTEKNLVLFLCPPFRYLFTFIRFHCFLLQQKWSKCFQHFII